MASRVLMAAALACTIPLIALGQDPPPVFKARSDLVVLHVNVFDGKSDAVPNLTRDNFMVFEDGKAQEITFFSNEDVPVAAGLVIDNSSSMITRRHMVVAGAMAFADSSHPEDELFTVYFNENVRLGLPPQFSFTSSRPLLRSTLARLSAGGKTALHDAVTRALDHVEQAGHQKHVIIVLSDGEDNASERSRDEMFDRAGRSDAIIYTIATNNPRHGGDGNPGVLRRLADIGGGLAYRPRSDDEVVSAFTEIAENIRRGYSIGYSSTNPARDGTFRKIKVMVRTPVRGLDARTRDGYTAPGPPVSR